MPESWAKVGIVFEDQYIQVLRDAVEFPGGHRGTYIRILSKQGEFTGVAVLPILKDKIVLLRHFRHATRAWHFEIPRGFVDKNESCDEAAIREVSEEIGVVPTKLTTIGGLHPNTGLFKEYVVLFQADIDKIGSYDEVEGIESVEVVSVLKLNKMIENGQITDSFTISALLLAQVRGCLPAGFTL